MRQGLGGLLATRVALSVAVLVAGGVWLGVTLWLGGWLRETTSNNAVLVVLVAYALLTLAVAGGVTVLIGDRIFELGWRERLIGGTPPPQADEVAPRSHVFASSSMVVVALIALFACAEALTGGALSEYFQKGAKRVTLRGDDEAAKRQVLEALGEERREDKVLPALELLDEVWRAPGLGEETRRAALSALGRIVASLNGAVDQWRVEGKHDRWQERLATQLRTGLGAELRAALADASPALRADLMRLLGLLREPGAGATLLAAVRSVGPEGRDAEWLAAVQGAMELRTAAALFEVGTEVARRSGDEQVALLGLATSKLLWAYHLARPNLNEQTLPDAERRGLEEVVTAWIQALDGSLARRCAAAMVLLRARHGMALEPLWQAFDRAEPQAMCTAEVVELGLGRTESLGAGILLRRRLLDAIAVVSGGSPQAKAWVETRLAAARRGELERELEPILEDFVRRLKAP